MSVAPHALLTGDSVVLPPGGPLYLQLKRWIGDAVASGAIGPGDALPSERELALKVDVSRVTVRKAVQHLVREGVLVQRHGSGTFVAPEAQRVEQSLSQLSPRSPRTWRGAAWRCARSGSIAGFMRPRLRRS